MKAPAVLSLSVIVVAAVCLIALASYRGVRNSAAAGGVAGGAAVESDPARGQADIQHGPADTPAERARTEKARQLLAAALAIGAAAQQRALGQQTAAPSRPDGEKTEEDERSVEDPHENRRLIVDSFVASGSTTAAWAQSAPKVFSALKGTVPANLARHIDLKHVECYEKGCLADVTYSDMDAFEKAASLFLQDDGFEGWPGPRGRTAPETVASGKVEVTWMLMNPGEGTL